MKQRSLPLRILLPGSVVVSLGIAGVGVSTYLSRVTTAIVYSKVDQRLQSVGDSLLFGLDAMRGSLDSSDSRTNMRMILENAAATPDVIGVYLVKPDMKVFLDAARQLQEMSVPPEIAPIVRDTFPRRR